MKAQDLDDCPICLWPINEDVLQLGCGHYLHGRCVSEMRCHDVSNTCPLCREPLSELRTVPRLLDEAATLMVRVTHASGMNENGSIHGRGTCNPGVNVQALAKEMLMLAQEAYTLDPTNWSAQVWLGEALTWSRLYADAKAHYLRVLGMKPAREEILHHTLGQTLMMLQEYDDAFAHLYQAVNLCPDWWKPHKAIGLALFESYTLRTQRDNTVLENSEYHLSEAVRLNPQVDQASRMALATASWLKKSVKENGEQMAMPNVEELRNRLAMISSRLKPGAQVVVNGLQSSEGKLLNGRYAVVQECKDTSGRIRVEIDGAYKRLKTENLIPGDINAVMKELGSSLEPSDCSTSIPVGTDSSGALNASTSSPEAQPTELLTFMEFVMDPLKDPEEAMRVALAESFETEFENSLSELSHDEMPATVLPAEAAQVSQERSASWLEHRAPPLPEELRESAAEAGEILVLTFSRHPARLADALLSSTPAQVAAASGVDLQPPWANGGKVFVEAMAPELFDDELSAYKVVIRRSDEDAIWAALEHVPYHIRKLKPGVGRTVLPGRLDNFDVSSIGGSSSLLADEVIEVTVTVKNTFIHVGPVPDESKSAVTM